MCFAVGWDKLQFYMDYVMPVLSTGTFSNFLSCDDSVLDKLWLFCFAFEVAMLRQLGCI